MKSWLPEAWKKNKLYKTAVQELEAKLLSITQYRDSEIRQLLGDEAALKQNIAALEQKLNWERYNSGRKDVVIKRISLDHKSTKDQLKSTKELLSLYERYENHLAKRRSQIKLDNQKLENEIVCLKLRDEIAQYPMLQQENQKLRCEIYQHTALQRGNVELQLELTSTRTSMNRKDEEVKSLEGRVHELARENEISSHRHHLQALAREDDIIRLWAKDQAHTAENYKTVIDLANVMRENQSFRKKTSSMDAKLADLAKENRELRQVTKVTEVELQSLSPGLQDLREGLEEFKEFLTGTRDHFLDQSTYLCIHTIRICHTLICIQRANSNYVITSLEAIRRTQEHHLFPRRHRPSRQMVIRQRPHP